MAISSAMRTGLAIDTSGPSNAILARLTICVSAPASGATEGARMSGE